MIAAVFLLCGFPLGISLLVGAVGGLTIALFAPHPGRFWWL